MKGVGVIHKDTDFLYLTSMLRAREAGMLSKEKIDRMLDASEFDDAVKILLDCGYPDMSGMNSKQIEDVLQKHRAGIFSELSGNEAAHGLANLFQIKYDYHNVKVLVKAMGANVDASYMLSDSGRIDAKELTDAFISGERQHLPHAVAAAMGSAVGILSRTKNPQTSDIEIDKAYYAELLALALQFKNGFITDYVRLLIDSANLRTTVRALRTARDADFLLSALIPGGNADIDRIAGAGAGNPLDAFTHSALESAVRLGAEAIKGGAQTHFELACDNAVMYHISGASLESFGPGAVVAYLAALEWEITAVRMILTGKLTGIAPEVVRERLRDCYV